MIINNKLYINNILLILLCTLTITLCAYKSNYSYPFQNPALSYEERVKDLVSSMTFEEKISQLLADAPAIPRLDIPAYSFRNECLHGVVSSYFSTVFPQSIGMGATWDVPLIRKEAEVIATEARAQFNDYTTQHHGNSDIHHGISFYAPNINIDRDPRWGRGQETYGEDPFLTSRLGVAFICGLQGDNPKYIKAMACAKHFAVYSGPEPLRHQFDATPPERDLYDTYLPAFEAAVRNGHVGSVMGAYSALYGVPDCANPFLLTKLLRKKWGFSGFVVSDGAAIVDIWAYHKYVVTPEEAVAAALKAGCDLFSSAVTNTGSGQYPSRDFAVLAKAAKKGLITDNEIDTAVMRTLEARFRLGLFDPRSLVPWSKITLAQNNTPENRALALKVARESIVLLKNTGVLPLDREKIKRILVIGPNANSKQALLGNYAGKPSDYVTILDGIKQMAGTNIKVIYEEGCPLALKNDSSNNPTSIMMAKSVAIAKSTDVIIYVGGLDATLENEQQEVDYQGFLGGDRTRIELPSVQKNLLKALYSTGKPIIFVNCSGSAIAMQWENNHLQAILQAWYPGEEGGEAVADVLFGNYNPAGRLPVTFYKSTKQLPSFTDYSMKGRTYRYFKGEVLYPFGFGLSYTKFSYTWKDVLLKAYTINDTIKFSVQVSNIGQMGGDEVLQAYIQYPLGMRLPLKELRQFQRIHIEKNQSKIVTFEIPIEQLQKWNINKDRLVYRGKYTLFVGGNSEDRRLNFSFNIQ